MKQDKKLFEMKLLRIFVKNPILIHMIGSYDHYKELFQYLLHHYEIGTFRLSNIDFQSKLFVGRLKIIDRVL
jgi:hypothetical protein